MYGLCDCNNFFVSCERVFEPSLEGRPVVVLSNNDGCIISRSNEAKALGIRMGEPYFKARELLGSAGVRVFSSNYELYGDMSARVMDTLRSVVPGTEVYSIDEAFLDLSGIPAARLRDFGRTLRRTVKRNTGIPTSIGIAPTKTLAKVASKLCKQYPALQGACFMHQPADVEKVLRKFPIEDIWGIGRRYCKMLGNHGIATAWDFAQRSPEWIQARMGIFGLRTWKELHGEPCIGFEDTPQPKKQICVSRSFAKEVSDPGRLRELVSNFAFTCAEKLRTQGSCASEVMVFLVTNRHREDQPQQYQNRITVLPVATDSTIELTRAAGDALALAFEKGYRYKRAGVILGGIVSRGAVQADLFDRTDRERHARLMETLDMLNRRYGRRKVVVAAQGTDPVYWNREFVSPRRTTQWDEIMEVKV